MTIMSRQTRPDTSPVSRFARWGPLAVVLSGTFMFVLDFFILNVALPDIQRGLRATAAAIEWLVSGYALSTASLLVVGGHPEADQGIPPGRWRPARPGAEEIPGEPGRAVN